MLRSREPDTDLDDGPEPRATAAPLQLLLLSPQLWQMWQSSCPCPPPVCLASLLATPVCHTQMSCLQSCLSPSTPTLLHFRVGTAHTHTHTLSLLSTAFSCWSFPPCMARPTVVVLPSHGVVVPPVAGLPQDQPCNTLYPASPCREEP